jgi:chromosome segregation ATPase
MSDIVGRITKAKEAAARAQQMRADANSAISFARTQLDAIDTELKAMGIDPENASQELAALEAQLGQTVDAIEAQLATEEVELKQILDLARQAQIIR